MIDDHKMDEFVIPNRAVLVFGQWWGGWTWLSISWNGTTNRWLFFWIASMDQPQCIYFSSEQDFEQWCDEADYYQDVQAWKK